MEKQKNKLNLHYQQNIISLDPPDSFFELTELLKHVVPELTTYHLDFESSGQIYKIESDEMYSMIKGLVEEGTSNVSMKIVDERIYAKETNKEIQQEEKDLNQKNNKEGFMKEIERLKSKIEKNAEKIQVKWEQKTAAFGEKEQEFREKSKELTDKFVNKSQELGKKLENKLNGFVKKFM